MSYLDWHVGMKVVCVKEGGWNAVGGDDNGFPKPKYGEICTISHLAADDDGVFIAVEGYYELDLFWAGHFRKIQPRKSDISIFTAMLHDQRQKVPV